MTCPVKGSTGKGFLLLLTKLALSTSPTNPDGAAVGIFPDIGLAGETLAGVGGPKRLLNELLEDFVRLVVGFKAGCSSPSWNVEAILLSVLKKAKLGNDLHTLSRELNHSLSKNLPLVRIILLTCEFSEATMAARLSRCYLGKGSLTRTIWQSLKKWKSTMPVQLEISIHHVQLNPGTRFLSQDARPSRQRFLDAPSLLFSKLFSFIIWVVQLCSSWQGGRHKTGARLQVHQPSHLLLLLLLLLLHHLLLLLLLLSGKSAKTTNKVKPSWLSQDPVQGIFQPGNHHHW